MGNEVLRLIALFSLSKGTEYEKKKPCAPPLFFLKKNHGIILAYVHIQKFQTVHAVARKNDFYRVIPYPF